MPGSSVPSEEVFGAAAVVWEISGKEEVLPKPVHCGFGAILHASGSTAAAWQLFIKTSQHNDRMTVSKSQSSTRWQLSSVKIPCVTPGSRQNQSYVVALAGCEVLLLLLLLLAVVDVVIVVRAIVVVVVMVAVAVVVAVVVEVVLMLLQAIFITSLQRGGQLPLILSPQWHWLQGAQCPFESGVGPDRQNCGVPSGAMVHPWCLVHTFGFLDVVIMGTVVMEVAVVVVLGPTPLVLEMAVVVPSQGSCGKAAHRLGHLPLLLVPQWHSPHGEHTPSVSQNVLPSGYSSRHDWWPEHTATVVVVVVVVDGVVKLPVQRAGAIPLHLGGHLPLTLSPQWHRLHGAHRPLASCFWQNKG